MTHEEVSYHDSERLEAIHRDMHPSLGSRRGGLLQPVLHMFTLAKKLHAEQTYAEEVADIAGLAGHEAEVVVRSWHIAHAARPFALAAKRLVEAPQADGTSMTFEEYEQKCIINSQQRQNEIINSWKGIPSPSEYPSQAFVAWENALTRLGVQLFQRMTDPNMPAPTPSEIQSLVDRVARVRPPVANFSHLNAALTTTALAQAEKFQPLPYSA